MAIRSQQQSLRCAQEGDNLDLFERVCLCHCSHQRWDTYYRKHGSELRTEPYGRRTCTMYFFTKDMIFYMA